MASPSTEGPHTELYALLHVSQDADDEELRRAYRNLAMVYHPDKYQSKEMQEVATNHFQRIRSAFEVLIDPQQRQVYDIYGTEGLTSGLELGPKLKTKQEIREEYERAASRRKELQRQARTQPGGTIMMSVTASNFLKTWSWRDRPSVIAMQMGTQVQSVLSERDVVVLGGQMVSRRQMGGGTTSATWRRSLTDRATLDLTVVAGIRSLVSLSTSRQLTQRVNASMGVSYNWENAELELHHSWTRQLTNATSAGIQLNLGSESGIITNWHSQLEKGTISGDLKIGENFIGLTGSFVRRFSDFSSGRIASKIGLGVAEMEMGVSQRVSTHSTLGFSTLIGLQGVAWKLRINRGGFKFILPIILATSLNPLMAIGAVALPAVILVFLKAIVIEKWNKARKRSKDLKKRRENAETVAESRASAMESQGLLKFPSERKRKAQEEASGLIITRALYGNSPGEHWGHLGEASSSGTQQEQEENEEEIGGKEGGIEGENGELPPPVLDVTIPLQFFVEENERRGGLGTLLLHSGIQKRGLMGFCDPCPGEEKSLLVEYTFRGISHRVEVGDFEELRLPQEAHKLK